MMEVSGGFTEKKTKSLSLLIVLMIIVTAGLFVISFLFIVNFLDINLNQSYKDDSSEALVREIGEMYLLPDEIPTIATVSDKRILSEQSFFSKSENGDKVIVYQTSGFAILYRPSINKIVNVGEVVLENGLLKTIEDRPLPEKTSVLLLNGTSTVGLTQRAAEKLAELEFVNILDRDDAVSKPYDKTLVISQGEEFEFHARTISETFSAEVLSNVPSEEASTEANIVVILGEDFTSI